MINHYSDDLKRAINKWTNYIKKYERRPTTFFKIKKDKWRDIVFDLWRKERPDLKALEERRKQ